MIRTILFLCCLSTAVFAKPIFVGIGGGTGSGKTTLAEKIHKAFPGSILISQDSYYKDLSHLPMQERERANFDHPDSLDFALLRDHLIDLKNGIAIEEPLYSFHTHSREEGTRVIEPANIVLVEGILLLASPEVRDLFDLKIYVDTEDDIRILRRLERDIKERSRDVQGVKEQYEKTVKPMHTLFVEPSKRYADIVILGETHNPVAVDLIVTKLKQVSQE